MNVPPAGAGHRLRDGGRGPQRRALGAGTVSKRCGRALLYKLRLCGRCTAGGCHAGRIDQAQSCLRSSHTCGEGCTITTPCCLLRSVCVVNSAGNVLLDRYVRPKEKVTDFRTKVSGEPGWPVGWGARGQCVCGQCICFITSLTIRQQAPLISWPSLTSAHKWSPSTPGCHVPLQASGRPTCGRRPRLRRCSARWRTCSRGALWWGTPSQTTWR